MKRINVFAIFLLMITGIVFFGGCNKKVEQAKKQYTIGYVAMDMTNPFMIAMRDAAKAVADSRGDDFISADAEMNQLKQNNSIEDMITRGIDFLILNPADSKGVQPALEMLAEAEIPVINVDTAVDDLGLVNTYISSNNFQAGKLCGEEMVRLFPDGADICILEFTPAESVVNRVKGLESALEGSSVKIVGRKDLLPSMNLLAETDDLIQAHPGIKAFWGFNDDVSLVIQGTVESAGLSGQIRVFSVDGSPSGKKSIVNSGLYATAAQSPSSLGRKAAELGYTLLDGGSVEKNYSIDCILVTPDNIASMDADKWQ
jgi:ribose transport system substrate-binding protein